MNQFTQNWLNQTHILEKEIDCTGRRTITLRLSHEDRKLICEALKEALHLFDSKSIKRDQVQEIISKLV